MIYLERFHLPDDRDETSFCLSYHYKIEMECYDHQNIYPFHLFPQKGLCTLDFAPITILYGDNGSGKSTLLNIIGEKLNIRRTAPGNRTPFFDEYLQLCRATLPPNQKIPENSALLSSDDVFDFLLNLRSLNSGVDRRRDELFDEYDRYRDPNTEPFRIRSLSDYDELKARNEARHRTKSNYTTRRLPQNIPTRSNGESAYECFTSRIRERALYLLDEPENSLSVKLQKKLADFLQESVRFYHCQLIISTHSPFLLSLHGAKIYDLDTTPVAVRPWTSLENMQLYYEFFQEHKSGFDA